MFLYMRNPEGMLTASKFWRRSRKDYMHEAEGFADRKGGSEFQVVYYRGHLTAHHCDKKALVHAVEMVMGG